MCSRIVQEIKLYRRNEHMETEKNLPSAPSANLRVKKNKAIQPRQQQSAVKVTFHNEAKAAPDNIH